MYWNSSCPGRSWQALTIFATRRSFTCSCQVLPLLPLNWKRSSRAFHLDVRIAQGREAVALVLLRVVVVADADQRGLEQVHHGGQHLLARQAAQRHVLGDARRGSPAAPARTPSCARTWCSRCTSRNCGWYLYCLRPRASRPVACRWPLAFGQIHTSVQAGGMASRRMRSSVGFVAEAIAIRLEIREGVARALAPNPALFGADVDEAGGFGNVAGIDHGCADSGYATVAPL